MNPIATLVILTTISLLSCSNTPSSQNNNSKVMTDPQHPANPYYSRTDTTVLHVSDAEWKKVLPDSVYGVVRNKDTECPFTETNTTAAGRTG